MINLKIISAVFIIVLLIVLSIIIILKNKEKTPDDIVKPTDTSVIYADNVFMLKGSNFDVSTSEIIINKTGYKLKKGDIVIGEESPGFLRKIENITIKNGKTTLETIDIEIKDVLKESKISNMYTITNDIYDNDKIIFSIVPNKHLYGVDPLTSSAFTELSKKASKTYSFPYNKVIDVQTDLKIQEASGTVTINGLITATPSCALELDIGWSGLKLFSFITSLKLTGAIEGIIDVKTKNLTKTWSEKLKLGKWIIPVCAGVYLTITPSLVYGFDLNVDATLNSTTKLTIETTKPYIIGFSYVNKIGSDSVFTPIYENAVITNKFTKSANLTVKGVFKPFVDILLDVGLYDSIGILLTLHVYYKYTLDMSFALCGENNSSLCPKDSSSSLLGFLINLAGYIFSKKIGKDLYLKEISL